MKNLTNLEYAAQQMGKTLPDDANTTAIEHLDEAIRRLISPEGCDPQSAIKLIREAVALLGHARPQAGTVFCVDVPPAHRGPTGKDASFIHVAEFDTYAEAVNFCRETYGADEEGRVCLISPE